MERDNQGFLDKVVECYLDDVIRRVVDTKATPEAIEEIRAPLRKDIRADIIKCAKKEMLQAERAKIHEQAQDELIAGHIQNAKKLLLEGVVIAFLVGLLVNQVTNWIGKGIAGNTEVYWIIFLVVILSAAIYMVFNAVFFSEVTRLIKQWRK